MVLGLHDKHHPQDDIEANAVLDFGSDSRGPDARDLAEYEKLDRFITTYDVGGAQHGTQVDEKEVIPWWKFWKSSGDGDLKEFDGRPPPAWLETDIHHGISSSEVLERRRRFGWNELTAEKENQFRKFLSFFQGPILYGNPPTTKTIFSTWYPAVLTQMTDFPPPI